MHKRNVNVLGMELDRWTHKSCCGDFGVGENWATLYSIESKKEGRGDATELLRRAKIEYERQGKVVGGTIALNPKMRKIYNKLGYIEYI